MIVFCCERKIKIKNGPHTQTVNIYSENMIHGEYDFIIRIKVPENFVEGIEIDNKFNSIDDLITYLKDKHYGQVENNNAKSNSFTPEISGVQPKPRFIENFQRIYKNYNFETDEWLKQAIPKAESIIDEFLKHFIRDPYLHRVEHSIHLDLYNLLVNDNIFNQEIKINKESVKLVHKEWPEFTPRDDKNNRRGNFDIAILSPGNITEHNLNDFLTGRIEAPIVIEMGLNYSMGHFTEDLRKLSNSNVFRGYLLHLVRKEKVENDSIIENNLITISQEHKNIKVGYVRHTCNSIKYKLINDMEIKELPNGV